MNQCEFMKKLKKALRWTFDANEIEDILSDYQGFFDDGVNEGKSEQTICEELGDPNNIAFDLATELRKEKRISLSTKVMRRMFLVTLLLVISFVYYNLVQKSITEYAVNRFFNYFLFQNINIFSESMISMILFIIILWFTLGGTIHKLPPISQLVKTVHKWIILANHFILFFIFIIFHILIIFFIKEMEGKNGLINIDIEAIKNMWILFMAISFTLAVLSIYGFYRFTPQYFTIICHAIGVVAYLCSTYSVSKTLISPEEIQLNVRLLLSVYAVSFVITIIFSWLIHVLQKRRG